MNYIYNDEDNSPMHEENMPPEDKGCKHCPGKVWCEKPKTETDYESCEHFKIICRWWSDVKSGHRDRAKGITDEIPFADEDDFTTADLEED